MKESSVVLFTFNAAHLPIICAFAVNAFYPLSFTSLFTLSVYAIFSPNLSKLSIDAKYMSSKTCKKVFYDDLGYIRGSSSTYMPSAGLVLILRHWNLSIILNCMWVL